MHTTGIYSKYKAAGEEYRNIEQYVYKMCKENNVLLTILRPTMIYGNMVDHNISVFIKMIDNLPIMPIVDNALYELQPVHYMDLGKAYIGCLFNEDKTINRDFILSGEKPILLRDIFIKIGQNLGKEVRFFSVPFHIAYGGAVLLYFISLCKIDFREKVQRLCEPRIFKHHDAKEAFGFSPISFDEGIKFEVSEYMEKNK